MRDRKVHVAETISENALGPTLQAQRFHATVPGGAWAGFCPSPVDPADPQITQASFALGVQSLCASLSVSLSFFLLLFLFPWTTRRGSVTGDGRRAIMATRGGSVVLKLWALVLTSGPQQRAEMKFDYLKVCESNLRDTDILGSNVG